ncbi:hypothetical protein P171DRAFT_449900 [Karstenula rhodostoma CBS 690.94]|uniref:Uncharacterized protein n=1 Tax=Karstenula rhodostoma CBS 690.94 TaxID=1392251 RepID=A0A9P4U561_9PLEO|nr:hypothetical protein P171DRAFT_449900 [Karstenula rhodostoma CBS 690.94]
MCLPLRSLMKPRLELTSIFLTLWAKETVLHTVAPTIELASPDTYRKPVYPAFPPAFADKLPCVYGEVDDICVCYIYLPELWAQLGEYCGNLMLGLADAKTGETVSPGGKLRNGCDLRDALKFMHLRLDTVMNTEPASKPFLKLVEPFHDQLSKARVACDWRQLPDVQAFSNSVGKALFGGTIARVSYNWVTHTPEEGLVKSKLGSTLIARSYHEEVQVNIFPPAFKSSDRLIGTAVHEQIHAFLDRHLCRGQRCRQADQSQIDLCKYLSDRMVGLFDSRGAIGEFQQQLGHGPAFQHLARHAQQVLEKLMGRFIDTGDIISPCQCTTDPQLNKHLERRKLKKLEQKELEQKELERLKRVAQQHGQDQWVLTMCGVVFGVLLGISLLLYIVYCFRSECPVSLNDVLEFLSEGARIFLEHYRTIVYYLWTYGYIICFWR